MIQVGIIMGSNSDWPVMQQAAQFLKEFGVEYEARVVSAHRTPDLMFGYAETARERGIKAIIAGAGGAAHLPGMVAAKTTVPVLGVPVPSKYLRGEDSCFRLCKCPKASLLLHLPLAKPVQPMQRCLPFHFWPTKTLNWLKNWPLSVPNKNKPF